MLVLPEETRQNRPTHEREPALFMDVEVNSVSFLSVLVHIFLFSMLFTEINS